MPETQERNPKPFEEWQHPWNISVDFQGKLLPNKNTDLFVTCLVVFKSYLENSGVPGYYPAKTR